MSRTESNTACTVCHRGPVKWMCKCGNEALCAEGACLATHMSKDAKAHVLMQYEAGVKVSGDLMAACLQHFDKAMEAAEYLNEEVQWLTAEKNRLRNGIDGQVEVYVNQIRRLGEEKKKELDQLLRKKIQAVESFGDAGNAEDVLEHKRSKTHIETLECAFNELSSEPLIEFDVCERVYKLAQSFTGNWSFNGHVDALSIQVSKRIFLMGLGLPKRSSRIPLFLQLLQVLKGNSIDGKVIYSDTEARDMDSSHSHLVKVMLKYSLKLDPNSVYTLKALILGGVSFLHSCSVPELQDGLTITPSSAVFSFGERSNGSDPGRGIFLEIYYR